MGGSANESSGQSITASAAKICKYFIRCSPRASSGIAQQIAHENAKTAESRHPLWRACGGHAAKGKGGYTYSAACKGSALE